MSEQLYAIIGRKAVESEQMTIQYDNLLTVLTKVLSGEYKHEDVTVDMATRSWAYNPAPMVAPSDPIPEAKPRRGRKYGKKPASKPEAIPE